MKELKIGLAGSMQSNFAGGAGGGKERIYEQSARKIKELAGRFGCGCFVYPELLVTGEDAAKAREAFEREGVDFALLQITTFSAGAVVLEFAKTDAALGLWALPEQSMKGSIFLNSLNSFCGLNMFSSIIINYLKGIKHKWFYGDPDDEMFIRRLEVTARALTAVKNLKTSKLALVGGIAPGFNDLYFDERLGQERLGIKIERGHEFSEIQGRAEAYTGAEIERYLEGSASARFDMGKASKENRDAHARYYKAYMDFAGEYGYDALAVSCWPQMATASSAYSCSIVSKLNQDGVVAACEGDLPGAASMLLQKYIIKAPVTLMDLSGIDESDQTILMWHCGPTPECYADDAGACLEYCRQPIPGSEEENVTGMITDMVFRPQAVTFVRITGEWDGIFLLDGKTAGRQKDSPQGSRGWVEALRLGRKDVSVRDLMNTILVQGMQHHYAMAAGDITEELMEAAAWLGLKPVETVRYENYLQLRDW